MKYSAKELTTLAVSVALAMIFSFVESQIPTFFPGIKLGLANSVTLFLLYTLGVKCAIGVSVVRIFLSTLLFGSFPIGLIYSYSGALLSFVVMLIARWLLPFGIIGVSVLGGVFHNLGQVVAACLIMETAELIVYFIPLFVSGIVAGVVVGILSGIVIARLKDKIKFKDNVHKKRLK